MSRQNKDARKLKLARSFSDERKARRAEEERKRKQDEELRRRIEARNGAAE